MVAMFADVILLQDDDTDRLFDYNGARPHAVAQPAMRAGKTSLDAETLNVSRLRYIRGSGSGQEISQWLPILRCCTSA